MLSTTKHSLEHPRHERYLSRRAMSAIHRFEHPNIRAMSVSAIHRFEHANFGIDDAKLFTRHEPTD